MIYLTIGIPGSGKSTWAKGSGYNRVCRDDIRLMLQNAQMLDSSGEKLVTRIVESTIANKGKKDLVVDQTNCNLKTLTKFIDYCTCFDDVELVIFDIDVNEAIERDSKREKSVGREVILRMKSGFDTVIQSIKERNFPQKDYSKIKLVPEENLGYRHKAIIVDIDGTLAHMQGIRSPYEWNKVDLDNIDQSVLFTLNAHKAYGTKIIIVSGRDGVSLEKTKEWLESKNVPHDVILMRGINDPRKDFVVKEEIYNTYIKQFYEVMFVLDDRPSVIRMWKSIGLKVFDCGDGVDF